MSVENSDRAPQLQEEESAQVCRYCLETEPTTDLIRPCRCTTPVHVSCLGQWLAVADRAVDELQCELCQEPLRAKLALAPFSTLFRHKEGRTILLLSCLRFLYRLFLFRRLYHRSVPLIWRVKSMLRKPSTVREKMALYRDFFVTSVLGWLCCQTFVRDVKRFWKSSLSFRRAYASLTIYDVNDEMDGDSKYPVINMASIARTPFRHPPPAWMVLLTRWVNLLYLRIGHRFQITQEQAELAIVLR